MSTEREPSPSRLRRLAEELAEEGLALDPTLDSDALLLREIDNALRPPVHERRTSSVGTFIGPTTDPEGWESGTGLAMTRGPIGDLSLVDLRRFADGLSSWVMRHLDGSDEWVIFDRPTGSERDLVILAEALGATVVQRHPTGTVRVVGEVGVLRSEGLAWHHEPPVSRWVDELAACGAHGDPAVLRELLEFAVHDLGSRGVGAILVYRTTHEPASGVERRLPPPPPLQIRRATALGPLRHALAQIDGAAVFDPDGKLVELGSRLVPSAEAERSVDGFQGMRHTSGRRYSSDDEAATVIVVSEDGPVSVFRKGELLGRSPD